MSMNVQLSVVGVQVEAIGPVQKKTTTPWWTKMANVVCWPCRRGASRVKWTLSVTEETTASDVATSEEVVPQKAATSDVAATEEEVAEVKTNREQADGQVPLPTTSTSEDENDSPPPRRRRRGEPYASESKVERVIVSRGDLKAEREQLLSRTAGEGVVRHRANSVGRPSPLAEWKPRADEFLADARTAVDEMRARLAAPRHRSRAVVAVAVPENADDQRRPYVERAAWKPRVNAFRTHNAFFQYQSRRPISFIVLNA